jgi:hypothetical protein
MMFGVDDKEFYLIPESLGPHLQQNARRRRRGARPVGDRSILDMTQDTALRGRPI